MSGTGSQNTLKKTTFDKIPEHVQHGVPALDTLNDKSKLHHPLEYSWEMNFWHANDWQNTTNICTISTIEDFWGMYNNIPKLSECTSGNFSFFHKDIRPVWEDEINQDGGKWLWEYSKIERESLDNNWMNLLLLLIGETMIPTEIETKYGGSQIFGVTVHTRYGGDRMTLWTKNTNVEIQTILGKELKTKLNICGNVKFKAHKDAIQINSSFNSSAKIIL
jgi:translation initiation factor 4E